MKELDLTAVSEIPPKTWLWSVDGVPVSTDEVGQALDWSTSPPSFFSSSRARDEGGNVSLDEFKALVAAARASSELFRTTATPLAAFPSCGDGAIVQFGRAIRLTDDEFAQHVRNSILNGFRVRRAWGCPFF